MILPVLDLMRGQIVRGIAGQRDAYRPIKSTLVQSPDPLAVAQAFRTQFGFNEFYLADLDAIQLGQPSPRVYQALQNDGFRLWIDAGLCTSQDATLASLLEANAASIIVGSESVEGPDELQRIVQRAGVQRVVFSLDLKAGRPLGRADLWPQDDAWSIAEHAISALGIRRLIVLDLACVGVGAGIGTEALCVRLKEAFPALQLIAGGGVRHIDDVKHLLSIGVDCVLVASALHDGRLTPNDIQSLQHYRRAEPRKRPVEDHP